jgi:hypothetical protein
MRGSGFVINLPTVPDHQYKDQYLLILNFADQPIISNAVFPPTGQFSSQWPAIAARVIIGCDPLPQIA